MTPDGTQPHRPASRRAESLDTLLECLLIVVRAHGGTLSREAATSGRPSVLVSPVLW
ncbi:MAG TPA: hypothetical protein PL023_12630 [Thiobacillus sp.]|nr:hypothetical protein [Thiobacillus sp.]